MDDKHDIIAAWIAKEIIPVEGAVRSWLSRRWSHVIDVEDVIQDAYCRIANLASVDHIDNPKSYFFSTAHAVVRDAMRRAGIINFTHLAQIDWSNVMDNDPLADRVLEGSGELARVNKLLSQLSDTHRRAIELRRIEGLSRKEAAQRLGVSEDALKKHVERGMRQIMAAMTDQDERADFGEQDDTSKVNIIGIRRPR